MSQIMWIEDGEERLGAISHQLQADSPPNRLWSIRQCMMNNGAAALRQMREWLNEPTWSMPLILAVDAQITRNDRERLLGIEQVYQGLLQSPGCRWKGLAVISEHIGNDKHAGPEVRDVAGRIVELVTGLNECFKVDLEYEVFFGNATGHHSIQKFSAWANKIADDQQ